MKIYVVLEFKYFGNDGSVIASFKNEEDAKKYCVEMERKAEDDSFSYDYYSCQLY